MLASVPMLLAQRWALSTSSILTRLNGGAPYQLGGASRTSSEWVSSIKGVLQSSWGVTDTASLHGILSWLRESGHGAEYDKLQGLCNQSLQQYGPSFAFEQHYPEEAQKLRFVQQYQGQIGSRSLLAWDAGRLVAVAGWGYLAGYIEEREAWGHILPAAALLQRAYQSWEELSTHYLLGLFFWGGPAESALIANTELLSDGESPYNCIPWLTPISIPGVEAQWGTRFASMYARFPDPAFPTPREPVIDRPNYGPQAQILKDYDGARLVLRDGERRWDDAHDTDMPRDQWRDEWGPLTRPQWDFNTANELLEQFFADQEFFNHINRSNPVAAEQELLKRGYRSVGQYFRVFHTISKHYGTPGSQSMSFTAFDDADCQHAMLKAGQLRQAQEQQRALAGNPELIAPIEGLDLQGMALLASHQTAGTAGQEWAQLLAGYRLDEAAYRRVSAGWAERFQGDTTGALGQTYAALYRDALQELQNKRVASGAGKEVTFDLYCEITGAMVAWGQLGLDMNAEIEKVFGMTMTEYSMGGMPWGTKLAGDVNLLQEYMMLLDRYTVKHGGSVAQPEPDEPTEDDNEPWEDEDEEEEEDDDDDDDF